MDCLALGLLRLITISLAFNLFPNWHRHGYRALGALRDRTLLVVKEACETLCQRRELLPLSRVCAGLLLLVNVFLEGDLFARPLRKFVILVAWLVSALVEMLLVSGCP